MDNDSERDSEETPDPTGAEGLAWVAKYGEELSGLMAARFRLPKLPEIQIPTMDMSWLDGWARDLAQTPGINEAVRQATESLAWVGEGAAAQLEQQWASRFASFSEQWVAQVERQWEGVFASLAPLAELAKSYYPPNVSEALPTLEELEKLLVDEGVPLMWVPGPPMVRALLDASDAPARRRIIGRRWQEATADCEAVLTQIDHPGLADARRFALDAVNALTAGHPSAAQALAANLLDSVLQKHFSKQARTKLTKNDFKKSGVRFNLDDYKFKAACTFAPVWYAHARYFPHEGDPIPRSFGRHASAHGVSKRQYSRVNATYAVLLVTSVIKFFDVELAR